jgi:hypothetical protein
MSRREGLSRDLEFESIIEIAPPLLLEMNVAITDCWIVTDKQYIQDNNLFSDKA